MAAPAAEDAPAFATTPDVVGNAFARQYYTILQTSPALVYRFYQDISTLGRPDSTGAMGSTTTMEDIDAKIQTYGSLRAEIKFVDAQASYNGGVIVLVTGSMIHTDESRRRFTQTFFLAPQDRGYFVLNDLFRYLDDDFYQDETQDAVIEPTTSIHEEASLVQENHVAEESNGEVYHPHENGEIPAEEEAEEEEEEEEEPVPEVVDEAPNDSRAVMGSNAQAENAPKKSYASIVMKDTPVAAPSPNLPKSVPKVQEQQMPAASAPLTVVPPSSADMLDDGSNHESEGDGHSIYVRNLPLNVHYAVVEEAFKRFGPIKSHGIQVRNQRGHCFGFVEFEAASAARSAIEASPVAIGGRDAVVEEKKSSSRGFSRGRFSPGRGGGGFKGEGGRGRGSYGGGRGYGRGEGNRNDFGNRGNSRGYQNRSEGFQRSDQSGTGAGRVSRSGGPGIGNTRAPRISANA